MWGCGVYCSLVFSDDPSETPSLHLTRVAPVGIASSAHGSAPPVFSNPYAANLHKNEKPPKWDGTAAKYSDWKWDFDRFLMRVGELPMASKNRVLEGALPDDEMRRFRGKQRLDPKYHANHFLDELERTHGENKAIQARKRLNNLQMLEKGKVKIKHLQEFEMELRRCILEMPKMTHEAIRRDFLDLLPLWMQQWMLDGEKGLRLREPTVLLSLLPETTEQICKTNVREMVHEDPLSVEKVGQGQFKVRMFSVGKAEKLTKFHRRVIGGSTQRVGAEMFKTTFSLDEAFQFFERELYPREHAEDFGISSRYPTSPIRNRQAKRAPSPPVHKEDKSVKIQEPPAQKAAVPKPPSPPQTTPTQNFVPSQKWAPKPPQGKGNSDWRTNNMGWNGPRVGGGLGWGPPTQNYFPAGGGWNSWGSSNAKGGKNKGWDPNWTSPNYQGGKGGGKGKGGRGKGERNPPGPTPPAPNPPVPRDMAASSTQA